MAFAVEGSWRTAGVCVRQDDGQLSGRVFAEREDDVDSIARQTARILSLDVDGRQFGAVGQRDPVVADLQRRYPGLRPVCFYSPYEAAVWAILSQRIQMRQAAAIKARLSETLGDLVDIHGQPMRAFPGPEKLVDLQEFAGLFANKASQLRALASAALAGELDWAHLRSRPEAEALTALQRLPGVGPFSAELILLRGAGHPDELTLVEPRFRDAVTRAYQLDHSVTDDELRVISEAWRPYRTWVTFLLRQDGALSSSGAGRHRLR
jgi:DNA-3-methyladenine glycosylase II